MNDNVFFNLWNQLTLLSAFPIYGDPELTVFDQLEKQIHKAADESKITVRQYVLLLNGVNEWRDIRARTSPATEDGAEEKGIG